MENHQKYKLRSKHFDSDKLDDPAIYGVRDAIKEDIHDWFEDYDIPLITNDHGEDEVYLLFSTLEDKMCFMHRWC